MNTNDQIIEISKEEMQKLEYAFWGGNIPRSREIDYTQREELNIELNVCKEHLSEILQNKNLKVFSIRDSHIPLEILTQLTILNQLEQIELSRYVDNDLLEKCIIELQKFKNLKKLTIDNSSVTIISNEICKLTSLEELNIYFTDITQLPQDIGNLINLVDLNIPNNHLSSLPESMKNLKKLKILTIYSKLIKDSLELKQHLPNLQKVYNLDNNSENILDNI